MKTKAINQLTSALLAMFVIIMFAISACSTDDDSGPNSNPDPDPDPINAISVNDYLLSLPSWETFSPNLGNPPEVIGEQEVLFDCNEKYVQTTTPCSITKTPEKIVTFNPNSEILYVGSLIQGDGLIDGLGSIKSLPIYQRAPLSVSIDVNMSNNSRTVDNPNLTTVNQAVGELVEAAHIAGVIVGSNIDYEERTSYSLSQTALSLGLSFKFLKSHIDSQIDIENSSKESTLTAYFKQTMYAINMGNPQTPGSIFSDDFTKTHLDEQVNLGRIGPNNLPVYVSNIVYGRMMIFSMTSKYSAKDMKAALDASSGNLGGELNAQFKKILEESTIKMVAIGGDQQDVLAAIRSGNVKDYFDKNPEITSMKPISYTLRNLSDNAIAKVSETTDYDMVQYGKAKLYNKESDWRADVQSLEDMQITTWNITRDNLYKANERDKFYKYKTQLYMFDSINFSSSNTYYPFDFYIKSNDPAAQKRGPALVNLDIESDNNGFPIEFISIGDVNDYDNDDFEIGVTDGNVHGIGFWVEGNSYGDNEFLEVHVNDTTGNQCLFLSTDEHINNFVGVISPVAIKDILFNEDEGKDDIALGDISFGYKEK